MGRVVVVQPGGGEAIAGGTSVRRVKVVIESLHLTEYSGESAPMGRTVIRQQPALDGGSTRAGLSC
jgi:hypothetical protein